ncbi:MAG TPA: threonine/serine dehydratase [Terriglobales bacterium]|nr:threonine/serine dehydratase [Terriglobales bacterium]
MVSLDNIRLARHRLEGIAVRTPILKYPRPIDGRTLFLKPESLQPIGSFKLRGAYNKIASLSNEERRRGVISYSSGNHAQGVAYAARAMGVNAVIVMPDNAPRIKRDGTAALGAEIVTVGPASSERKAKAEELAQGHGFTIVPPYNDENIIAGAASVGMEIIEDLPEVQAVLVPVGGGGLISGTSAAVKLSRPDVKVIGVEPELANDAQRSFRSGHIVELSAQEVSRTVADGLRTQSVGEINFEHIRCYVDTIITVSEAEILEAMRRLVTTAKLTVEPSGAVTTAAFMFHAAELPAVERTLAVISGGSVEPELLARVLHDPAAPK